MPVLALALTLAVVGTVTDRTGAPLPGVTVTAVPVPGGREIVAITAADGTYHLPVADAGAHDVCFMLSGFAARCLRGVAVGEGDTRADAVLELASFAEDIQVAAALDDVHETGSRLALARRQQAASVDTVTQDVIQARGADTASTALRHVTGLTSSLRPGASAVFSSRGFVENSIGILFNGIRVQSSTVTMRNYDAFNFDRVEVLRGPASVLHGEGLAAGAINFVRREAAPGKTRVEALLETGDAGRARVGAAVAGSAGGRSGYTASFARNRFGTHVDDTVHEYTHLTGALRSGVGRVSLGLEGDVFISDVEDPYWGTPLIDGRIDESLVGRNYNRSANNRYDDTVGWGRVTAAVPLGRRALYSGQVYGYRADRDWRNSYGFEFLPATGRVQRRAVENLAYDHRLWGTRHDVATALTLAGRPARLVAGADVSVTDFSSPRSYGPRVSVDLRAPESLDFEAPPRADDRRADLTQASLYGELSVTLAPPVTLLLGGRAGRLENDIARPASGVAFGQSFTPADGRVGVVVAATSGVSVYGQYATGSEPVEALLILGPAEGGFELARSALWEGGVKASLWGTRADVTAAVYRLAKRDLVTADPEDSTRAVQVGRQSARGLELSVTGRPVDRWLVEANLAVLDARYDLFFEGSASRTGNLPPNVPEVVFNLGTTVQPMARLEAGLWLTRIGRRAADASNAVMQPAYTLVDPFVRLALSRAVDVTIRARNATGERFSEWATRAFGVTNVYFGEPRRAIVSLRIRL